MSTHKLSLLENAIDSLNEGLRKYELGEDNERALKFAVLNVAHFVELYFKNEVVRRHDLFLYKNPFSDLKKRQITIDLWDALQFLENDGVEISKELRVDIESVKTLRNQIEHSHFEMNAQNVKSALGRLIKAVEGFNTSQDHDLIVDAVDPGCRGTYRALIDAYEATVRQARLRIRKEGLHATYCNHCHTIDVAVRREAFVECYFCGKSDPLVHCRICGKLKAAGGMAHSVPDDTYLCAKCLHDDDGSDYLETIMGSQHGD